MATSTYTIGRVACYLEHRTTSSINAIPALLVAGSSSSSEMSSSSSSTSSGSSSSSPRVSYNVVLKVYETDSQGLPATLKGTATLSSTMIQAAGWYFFDFSLTAAAKPTYGLAFVMYQEGGNEDDYVSWFYAPTATTSLTQAFMSADAGTTWTFQPNVCRTLQILDQLDLFSEAYNTSTYHAIVTTPGQAAVVIDDLTKGSFTQTAIESGQVVLQHPPLAISFVVDGSGSAGWNDRTFRRCELVKKIITDLPSLYPGDVFFDVVAFNGQQGGETFVTSNAENTAATTIAFSSGVKHNPDGSTSDVTAGDTSLANVVAYGIKGLVAGRTYTLANITAQTATIEDGQGLVQGSENLPVNFQNLGSAVNPVTFQITPIGPNGANAVQIVVPIGGATAFRKPLGTNRPLATTALTAAGHIGDTSLAVNDTSAFLPGSFIDVIDPNVSLHHLGVAAVPSGAELGLLAGLLKNVSTTGFVQESGNSAGVNLTGATGLAVSLLDPLNLNKLPITVYFETLDGCRFEWAIIPQPQWFSRHQAYLNQTMALQVIAQNADGSPIADESEVAFYVDSSPNTLTPQASTQVPLARAPQYGDTVIYVGADIAATIRQGATIILYATGHQSQPHVVVSVDSTGSLTVLPPIEDLGFTPTGMQIIPPAPPARQGGRVSVVPAAVDVTPMYAGRSLAWQAGDPPPVPVQDPTETNLNRYNQDATRHLESAFSVPLIVKDGTDALGAIRILPVTVDSLVEPDMSWLNPIIIDQAAASNAEIGSSSSSSAHGALSSNSSSFSSGGQRDYIIDNPVYTLHGIATSHMQTLTRSLSFTPIANFGISYGSLTGVGDPNYQRGLLSKSYSVSAFLNTRNTAGALTAQTELQVFEADFISPYLVLSHLEDDKDFGLGACVEATGDGSGDTNSTPFTAHGPYAASGEGFYIDYLVAGQGLPVSGVAALNIRVYDAFRSQAQMATPNAFQPNLADEVCGMVKGYEAAVAPAFFYGVPDPMGGLPSSIFNTITMAEATYLPGYTVGGFQLQLTNGQSRLQLPALANVVTRLVVVAEYKFPNDPNRSVYKTDYVWYRNPFALSASIPTGLTGGYNLPPTPLSAQLTWMGNPAPDNIPVNFAGSPHARFLSSPTGAVNTSLETALEQATKTTGSSDKSQQAAINSYTTQSGIWPATPITPAVGRTAGGAGTVAGVFLGPHGPVIDHFVSSIDPDTGEPVTNELGDKENITVSASYQGFPAKVTQVVEWTDTPPKSDFNYVIEIYKNGTYQGGETTLFADGWDACSVVADLPMSVDSAILADESIVDYLLGQTDAGVKVGNGKPRSVSFTHSSGSTWLEHKPLDPTSGSPGIPVGQDGSINRGWAISKAISKAMVVPPPKPTDPDVPPTCTSPWCWAINSNTAVLTNNGNIVGTGCAATDPGQCMVPNPAGTELVPTPALIHWREPLDGTFKVFSGGTSTKLIRDGTTLTDVWVDLTFSGLPLPFLAKAHQRSLQLPVVTFDAFKLVTTTDPVKGDIQSLVHDASVNLQAYQVQVSLSMTGVAGDSVIGDHYHTCSVDNNGNGTTTGTYLANSVTPAADHIHTVADFEVHTTNNHAHELRSIARTLLNPISDPYGSIHITAKVSYDASSSAVDRTGNFEFVDSVEAGHVGPASGDKYFLTLTAPQIVNTCTSVGNDQSGFSIQARLTKYTNDVQVPITADGIRLYYSLQFFEPVGSSDNVVWKRTGGVFNPVAYLLLQVTARATISGNVVSAQAVVNIQNQQPWVTQTKGLVTEPTNDPIYLANVTNTIGCFGPSPLHDAVYLAASRLLQWQIGNPSRRQAQKALLLVTDGWENASTRTISDAINAIQRIPAPQETPCAPVSLGQQSSSAALILGKYAEDTGGSIEELPIPTIPQPDAGTSSSSSEQYPDLAAFGRALFTDALSKANYGSFANIIDLGRTKLIKAVTLDLTMPTDSEGSYLILDYRFSPDGVRWGSWIRSTALSTSATLTIPNAQIQRYLQYAVGFYGNDKFVAPKLSEIEASFVEPRDHTILFAPVATNAGANEYVSEVVISDRVDYDVYSSSSSEDGGQDHSAKSIVRYGFAAADTVNDADFFSVEQPLSTAGRRKIILSRCNEPLMQIDNRRFQLLNGGWPSAATLQVYDLVSSVDGTLVGPDRYTTNPQSGMITFLNSVAANAKYSGTITFPPLFRLVCQVTNYSDAMADAVALRNIGVSWNVTQRTSTTHAPLGNLLSSSSSSSRSSSSSLSIS